MSDAEAGVEGWKKCSACKDPVAFSSLYYVCSVSTCNRNRTALRFCSVSCWEVHLPVARHREAWAEERTAPSAAEAAAEENLGAPASGPVERKPRRVIASRPKASGSSRSGRSSESQAVLIVASRLKQYVKAVSGYNTSDGVLDPLTQIVQEEIGKAIEKARAEGRRTVLGRDVST